MNQVEACRLLGLGPSFSEKELAKAIRKAKFDNHPDRGGDTEMFKRVCRAGEFLTRRPTVINTSMANVWSKVGEQLKKESERLSESKFQTQVKNALEGLGAFVFNIHGSEMQRAGIPDLRVDYFYWSGWLELKYGNNQASALQKRQMGRLIRNGSAAFVCRLKNGLLTLEWEGVLGELQWTPRDPKPFVALLQECSDKLAANVGHKVRY